MKKDLIPIANTGVVTLRFTVNLLYNVHHPRKFQQMHRQKFLFYLVSFAHVIRTPSRCVPQIRLFQIFELFEILITSDFYSLELLFCLPQQIQVCTIQDNYQRLLINNPIFCISSFSQTFFEHNKNRIISELKTLLNQDPNENGSTQHNNIWN